MLLGLGVATTFAPKVTRSGCLGSGLVQTLLLDISSPSPTTRETPQDLACGVVVGHAGRGGDVEGTKVEQGKQAKGMEAEIEFTTKRLTETVPSKRFGYTISAYPLTSPLTLWIQLSFWTSCFAASIDFFLSRQSKRR